MENNKNQTPVTEEVKEWSVGFMKTVETEGYDSMVSKLNELTPELKDGVLGYLQRIIDYCVKHSMNDHLEGVNTYKDLINYDTNLMETNCSKFRRKMLGKGLETVGTQFGNSWKKLGKHWEIVDNTLGNS